MTFPFLVRLHKMRELKRNATMSRADFEAMKLAKFRKLARYVLDASPYYADLIAEREIDVDACVPADFPVLTKSIVMANFDRIVTDRRITKRVVADFLTRSTDPTDLLFGDYYVVYSSGSSGEVGPSLNRVRRRRTSSSRAWSAAPKKCRRSSIATARWTSSTRSPSWTCSFPASHAFKCAWSTSSRSRSRWCSIRG